MDSNNALEGFNFKNREIQQTSSMYQLELNKASEKHRRKEQRFQRKMQRLKEEDSTLEKRYAELLDQEPDRILYTRPRSVFQWMRTRFLNKDK